MTDKEKFRAEIERRKNLADKQEDNGYFTARSDAYAELLTFIDSMQEEPKKCMYSKDNYTDEDRKVLCNGCEEECEFNKKKVSVSKDWSAEFDKILEPYKNSHNYNKLCLILRWWKSNYERWWQWKLNKKEEPVSEDMEEAAKTYAKKESHGYEPCNIVKTFKVGANWQKQQMMRGATDGQLENGEDYLRIKCLSMGCQPQDDGKLVKLIIIKEGKQ